MISINKLISPPKCVLRPQPSLPDKPDSPSRRQSRGGIQGELLTLKSQFSVDAMAADPQIVSRYPSLQQFSSTGALDSVDATVVEPPETHCCNCTKSEIACWVLTIACITLLAIGLAVYLVYTDWPQVGLVARCYCPETVMMMSEPFCVG